MNKDDAVKSLESMSPEEFVQAYLFDCIPWIFKEDREEYIRWKKLLSAKLEVDPACVVLVGSSALGCSMNPYKNFKPFDETSDVDVAVISQHHFSISWRYLRTNNPNKARVQRLYRAAWEDHKRFYIFEGSIATDRLLGQLPFGALWMKASGAMRGVAPTNGRDVKMRIYTDHEALRDYHIHNIRKLQSQLEEQKNAQILEHHP